MLPSSDNLHVQQIFILMKQGRYAADLAPEHSEDGRKTGRKYLRYLIKLIHLLKYKYVLPFVKIIL